MTVETFTASQLWTCPANVTAVQVECEGGGASGSSRSASATNNGGGGGGGGAYAKTNIVSVTPGVQYQVTVGDGGAAPAPGAFLGLDGTDSWFSTTGVAPLSTAEGCLADAGKGSVGTTAAAGIGGASADSIGDTRTSGSNGGAGGNSADGGAGGNGAAPLGGVGGAAQPTAGTNGNPGTAPGGGGGGGRSTLGTSVSGGAGTRGVVVLTYVAAATGTFTGVYDFSGSGFMGQAGPSQGQFAGSYDFSGSFTGVAPPPTPSGGNRWTSGGRDRFTARRTPKNRRTSR